MTSVHRVAAVLKATAVEMKNPFPKTTGNLKILGVQSRMKLRSWLLKLKQAIVARRGYRHHLRRNLLVKKGRMTTDKHIVIENLNPTSITTTCRVMVDGVDSLEDILLMSRDAGDLQGSRNHRRRAVEQPPESHKNLPLKDFTREIHQACF